MESFVNDLLQALWQESEPDCHVLHSLVRKPANLNEFILGLALSTAACKGFLNSVRILLEAGASPNTESFHRTPLHWCSTLENRTEIIRELLKHGADVNARDFLKLTPLHVASSAHCLGNIQEFVRNGATVDAVDFRGYTPLLDVMERSLDFCTVQELLRAGANVNFCNIYGEAPLHFAVKCRSLEVVKLLLRHKADANVKDLYGDTPLHRTAFVLHKPYEFIRELLNGGASLNDLNERRHSALYCAIHNLNEEATQALLRCGAAFDLVECLETLAETDSVRRPLAKIPAIAQEFIRSMFIKNPGSFESIRQQLMQEKVILILRNLSSPECNLENFKHACLSEVEALSKLRCDCGKSFIWDSINNCEECVCDTYQAVLVLRSKNKFR